MGLYDKRSFDSSDVTIANIGSFWRYLFARSGEDLDKLYEGIGNAYISTHLGLKELAASVSKNTVPIMHIEPVMAIEILESDLLAENSDKIRYGEGVLDYGSGKFYGQGADTKTFDFTIDGTILDIRNIVNTPVKPAIILSSNVDYTIDIRSSRLKFNHNPFDSGLYAVKETVDADGEVTARTLTLWLQDVEQDHQFIFKHFGYVLDIYMSSTSLYRDFVSATWDALVGGPSKDSVNRMFSALTGIPIAKGSETIEDIVVEGNRLFIISDKTVYEYKSSATPVVAVGDEVTEGSILVDSLIFIEPNQSVDVSQLIGVALHKNFLGSDIKSPLFFENENFPLEFVGSDAEGRTIVQFKVQGDSNDVNTFWRDVHNSGIAAGETLANVLDTRVNAPVEPGPLDLPETINPFQFMLDSVFSNNLYFVRLVSEDIADGAPGLSSLASIREFLSPHTTFMVFVEFGQGTDTVSNNILDDDLSFGPAMHAGTDTVIGSVIDHGLTFRVVKDCGR